MKKITAVIALICISLLCLGACGKKSSPETQNTAQTDSQTQAGTTASDQSADSGQSAGDPALIGNWQEPVFDSGFIFNADGTGTDTFWDLTFTYEAGNGEVLIIYDSDTYGASKYTYSVSGDTLSMTRIDEEETSEFTYTKVTSEGAATTAEIESDDGEASGE